MAVPPICGKLILMDFKELACHKVNKGAGTNRWAEKLLNPCLDLIRKVAMAFRAPPAVNLGLNFAVGMGLFSYIGYRIDQKRGGGGIFTLAGMFLGLVYGGYEVWKLLRQTPGNGEMEDDSP